MIPYHKSCAITGCNKHMCSAPLIGSRLMEKCLIISGMEVKGLLNWPRMKQPSPAFFWIRMCMNPLALLEIQRVAGYVEYELFRCLMYSRSKRGYRKTTYQSRLYLHRQQTVSPGCERKISVTADFEMRYIFIFRL